MVPGISGNPALTNGSGMQKVGGDAKSGNGDFSGGHAGSFSGPSLNKSNNGIDWKMIGIAGGLVLAGFLIWKKA